MFQRAKPERAVCGFSFKWKEHWILAFAMALWLLRVGREGQHLKYFEFLGFFTTLKWSLGEEEGVGDGCQRALNFLPDGQRRK